MTKPHSTPGLACPQCKVRVVRVRRHLADRLIGLFVPLRRYRCVSMVCGWEGLLRRPAHGVAELALTMDYFPRQVLDHPSRDAYVSTAPRHPTSG